MLLRFSTLQPSSPPPTCSFLFSSSTPQGLSSGFLCEFSVLKHLPSVSADGASLPGGQPMAEVELNMRLAGHWFGGGHYMRQHWPLDLGEFEVRPVTQTTVRWYALHVLVLCGV